MDSWLCNLQKIKILIIELDFKWIWRDVQRQKDIEKHRWFKENKEINKKNIKIIIIMSIFYKGTNTNQDSWYNK